MLRRLARRTVGCALTLAIALSPTAFAGGGWAAYQQQIEKSIPGAKCQIYGLDGGMWSGDRAYQVTADRIAALVANFDKPDALGASGFYLGAKKYMYFGASGSIRFFKAAPSATYVGKSAKSLTFCIVANGKPPHPATVLAMQNFSNQMKAKGF